jgi:integrase/recombinase XerD
VEPSSGPSGNCDTLDDRPAFLIASARQQSRYRSPRLWAGSDCTPPYTISLQRCRNRSTTRGYATDGAARFPATAYTHNVVGRVGQHRTARGEEVRLTISDAQLSATPPRLLVRHTKFDKSRWVPLHVTTAAQLADYLAQRRKLAYDALSDSLFISEKGTALRVSSLGRWFGQVVVRLGLWPEKGKPWPSLRSFRHTFAVRRVRIWYEEGADLTTLLPHLSVYLGHVSPEETYWYLTATPELLDLAAQRFCQYA